MTNYETEPQPDEYMRPAAAEPAEVENDIAAQYPGGVVFIDGKPAIPRQPPLTLPQLLTAGYWVQLHGGNPASMRDLRRGTHRRFSTYAIRAGINKMFGGDLERFAKTLDHEMQWPQSLLDGGQAWPSARRQPRELPQPIIPYAEAPSSMALPPTWGEVSAWYMEHYPLEYQIAEAAPEELAPAQEAPPSDRGMYWIPELSQHYRTTLGEQILNLEGVPHIEDHAALEEVLTNQAYLCIMADRDIRNGSETDPEALTRLTKAELTILNLLVLSELRNGRPAGIENLCKRSKFTKKKASENIASLIAKVNSRVSPRTIVTTGREHYRISPDAIVVDRRELPLEEDELDAHPQQD